MYPAVHVLIVDHMLEEHIADTGTSRPVRVLGVLVNNATLVINGDQLTFDKGA